jgi:hypothetical protein
MPDTAMTATEAATAAARSDIVAALQTTARGPVGHGAIRLRGRADPAPASVEDSPSEPVGEPAAAVPQRVGHGTIQLL